MTKRILLLTENFPPMEGGSCRWFWELYRRLPKDNIIIAADTHRDAQEFDATHDLNVVRMPLQCPEWGLRSIKGLAFYWKSVWRVRALVKAHNIDEIHCGRVIHEGVTAWLYSVLWKIPFRCFIHGEDVETAATSREHSWMVRQVCRNASMLICNSENSVQVTESLGFASANQCKVLHPGVDVQQFNIAEHDEAFRSQMGWHDKKVILTVGRLQKRKGQDYFIQAMAELVKQFPDLLYVVAGRGECYDELHALVNRLELSDNVHLRTDLDDEALVKSYQQCDLFILPNRTIGSDIEGFGMVLIEAQACGKAVLAGDSGGTRETMDIGRTGQIIDCTSPSSIVEHVSQVLVSKEYETWQTNAREFVVKQFAWEAHVEKAKALFSMQ